MAKKIKFPLEMSNGEQVRTLDELKENFDIESVVGYFNDGRLLNWLQARYYDEEADKISALSKDDPQLQKKLCNIFGVESKDEEIDVEEIANRQERLNRLKQYTDDKEILERVDLVAFNQEDLGDLLDEEKPLIYLCHNKFIIPLRETHKTYIGIGKAVAVIRSEEIVDFEEKHIKFKDVVFDDDYENLIKQTVSKGKNVTTAKNIADNSTISNEPANGYISKSKSQYQSSSINIQRKGNSYYYTTTIKNRDGIHARPASIFVQIASEFKSQIHLEAKGRKIDAKSILMLMSMGLSQGTKVTIIASGSDAHDAVEHLGELVDSGFEEY